MQQQPPQAAVLDRWPPSGRRFPRVGATKFLRPDDPSASRRGDPVDHRAADERRAAVRRRSRKSPTLLRATRDDGWLVPHEPAVGGMEHALRSARGRPGPCGARSSAVRGGAGRHDASADAHRRFPPRASRSPALVPGRGHGRVVVRHRASDRDAFNDPLAAATLFAPGPLRLRRRRDHASVPRAGDWSGSTSWHPAADWRASPGRGRRSSSGRPGSLLLRRRPDRTVRRPLDSRWVGPLITRSVVRRLRSPCAPCGGSGAGDRLLRIGDTAEQA